jgi:IS5 family transposase
MMRNNDIPVADEYGADLGYRGRNEILGVSIVTPDSLKTASCQLEVDKIKAILTDRSSIEPIIGYLKSDHRMDRNLLHGIQGDSFNTIMAAAAFNLKKFINKLGGFFDNINNNKNLQKKSRKPKNKTRAVPFWKPGTKPEFA